MNDLYVMGEVCSKRRQFQSLLKTQHISSLSKPFRPALAMIEACIVHRTKIAIFRFILLAVPVVAVPFNNQASSAIGNPAGFLNRHKSIQLLIALVFCFMAGTAVAATSNNQTRSDATPSVDSIKPLQIGDRVPEWVWEKPMQFFHPDSSKQDTQAIGQADGRWLILDFWATWCPACIHAMPKLKEVESAFSDKLKVLLVTKEAQTTVNRLLERSPIASGNAFSYIVQDTLLNKLFPNRIIPHEVWIDPEGIVRAITGHEEVSMENVQAMMDSKSKQLKQKEDNVKWNWRAEYDLLMQDPLIKTSSLLKSLDPGLPGGYSFEKIADSAFQYVTFFNRTPLQIFYTLFTRCIEGNPYASSLNPYQIMVAVTDSTIRKKHVNKDSRVPFVPQFPLLEYKNFAEYWMDIAVNYSFFVRNGAEPKEFFNMVFAELNSRFPISASVEKRNVECMVLKVVDYKLVNTRLLSKNESGERMIKTDTTTVKVKDYPMQTFVHRMNMFSCPRVIDETGISDLISIDISFANSPLLNKDHGMVVNMYPFDESTFRQQLNRYGLTFEKEVRPMSVLVIKDGQQLL